MTNIEKDEQKNDDVVLKKTDYTAIMQRLEKLEGGNKLKMPVIAKEHTAFVRIFKDKIVIGFFNVRKHWSSKEKGYIEIVDITTEDGKIHKSVEYVEFLQNSERVKVKINSVNRKKIVINQGEATEKEYDEKKGIMKETGDYVPANVVSYDEIALIETFDGRKLEIDVLFLNF